jgi:hypothetical protein
MQLRRYTGSSLDLLTPQTQNNMALHLATSLYFEDLIMAFSTHNIPCLLTDVGPKHVTLDVRTWRQSDVVTSMGRPELPLHKPSHLCVGSFLLFD